MLITPISWSPTTGKPNMYRATVHHRGKFVGVFENPTALLVIKNAVLRIEIMEMLSGKRMNGGITVRS